MSSPRLAVALLPPGITANLSRIRIIDGDWAYRQGYRKMVLVASRSVFEFFSADEETFANSQLWKNLLRRTCTTLLWQGDRLDHRVEVWGNTPNPGTVPS